MPRESGFLFQPFIQSIADKVSDAASFYDASQAAAYQPEPAPAPAAEPVAKTPEIDLRDYAIDPYAGVAMAPGVMEQADVAAPEPKKQTEQMPQFDGPSASFGKDLRDYSFDPNAGITFDPQAVTDMANSDAIKRGENPYAEPREGLSFKDTVNQYMKNKGQDFNFDRDYYDFASNDKYRDDWANMLTSSDAIKEAAVRNYGEALMSPDRDFKDLTLDDVYAWYDNERAKNQVDHALNFADDSAYNNAVFGNAGNGYNQDVAQAIYKANALASESNRSGRLADSSNQVYSAMAGLDLDKLANEGDSAAIDNALNRIAAATMLSDFRDVMARNEGGEQLANLDLGQSAAERSAALNALSKMSSDNDSDVMYTMYSDIPGFSNDYIVPEYIAPSNLATTNDAFIQSGGKNTNNPSAYLDTQFINQGIKGDDETYRAARRPDFGKEKK